MAAQAREIAEPAAGEGPSYIALLRWFWTFVGLDGVPIGGSALNDGRHYLRAVAILAPKVTQLIPGYDLACDSLDSGEPPQQHRLRCLIPHLL
jgi:hypothetical protein